MQSILIGSAYATLTAERKFHDKGSEVFGYTVTGPTLTGPLRLIKTPGGWFLDGRHQVQYNRDLINEVGATIEDEDTERFSDYDEEEQLRMMFPDEDSESGFDWNMEEQD